MKYASPSAILQAAKFFQSNPKGRINTGIWTDPVWGKEQFKAWFISCLLQKCGGSDLTEKQYDRILDARVINERFMFNIRRSGSGLLRTCKMQKRYPEINNTRLTDEF